MENWKKRSVNLLTSLAFGSESSPSVVPYYPQKTEFSSQERRYFTRSTPERHGISSRRIYSMLCALETERRANIHALLVLADGEVITECARDGYEVNIWQLSHSMSKTVTGMAIGLLYDEGRIKLDTRIVDIFPEIPYKDKNFSLITVEHLLAMTSGVEFGEAGSVTETGWLRAFFSSSLKFVPGSAFAYNSMNSYVLAMIVKRISGDTLTDYLKWRLFAPLRITNFFWEIGPEGVEKGGWGLYMSVESWAKIGQMVLDAGKFEGEVILSREWMEASTRKHADSPLINGDFNYGYQLWVGREDGDVLFNGMLGQNVWICPKNRIVAVITCGNNELFQDSPALETVRQYLGCDIRDGEFDKRDIRALHEKEASFFDCRRWAVPQQKRRGLLYWLGVRPAESYDERWDMLLGEYVFAHNNVGMLPLIVRGMQNNLDSRFESMRFEMADSGTIGLIFSESGVGYKIEIGLYEYKESIVDFRGEKYILRAIGEARDCADGAREYRIEVVFPEIPNTRMIRIFDITSDSISVEFTENPNSKLADAFVDRAATYPAVGFGLDFLEKRFGDGFITRKVEDTFAPVLIGAERSSEHFYDTIARESAKADEQSRVVRLMRSFVDRFFTDIEEKGTTKPEREASRGFIGDIIERIRFGKPRDDGNANSTSSSSDARSTEKQKISHKRAQRYARMHKVRESAE